jgi:hypothetical protein
MPIRSAERARASPRRWLEHAGMLLLIAPWVCAAARAGTNDSGTPVFSFSGFGTLGVVHSSEVNADFTSGVLAKNGAGYTHPWSTDVDSKLGGQVVAHATAQLSAVVQVISEQLYDGTYRPHVEWANLNYQFTPGFNVRIGRTVLPSFMFSDTRKVGYANPWVRPPADVYNLVPLSSSDGIDASYETRWGPFVNRLTGTYGKNDVRLPPNIGGTAHSRNLWLLSDTIEYGAASVHATYQRLHLTVPSLNALLDAFRSFGPQGIALADHYDERDKVVTFMALGAQYTLKDWFVMGEWGSTDYNSAFGKNTAWYATGGYVWRKLTPYLTYSEVKANSNASDPGLDLSAIPPELAGAATQLNAGLNSVLSQIPVEKTIAAGVRLDVLRNVALKIQYDHVRLGAGSPGSLINIQPDFRAGGTVNLLSATVDFVL